MKNRFIAILFVLLANMSVAIFAQAEDIMAGDLMLHDLWMKATNGNKPVTGGYLMIHNHGDSDDRLIGVEAAFAGKSEIHEMNMVDDVMQMRPLIDGLAVPAGEHVMLAPGGYHLMFMQLKEPIAAETSYSVTLIFDKAGRVPVTLLAKDIKDSYSHSH
jgi:copper(I)-binding protein